MTNINGNNKKNNLDGNDLDDVISGFGKADRLQGFGGNDVIDGGGGGDTIYGGNGDDVLIGGKGHDLMFGGDGADSFSGGDGRDTVSYDGSTQAVTAYVGANISGQGAAGDTYDATVENVIGSAFNDNLQCGNGGKAFGGAGNDNLFGSSYGGTTDGGYLRGDAGYDTLDMTYGDTRAWIQNGQGWDTINGFVEGSDMLFIRLSDFGLGDTLDLSEIVNSDTVTANGSNAQLIYEGDAGRLWFDANGNGAGGISLIAEFSGGTIDDANLGTNDFEFIA